MSTHSDEGTPPHTAGPPVAGKIYCDDPRPPPCQPLNGWMVPAQVWWELPLSSTKVLVALTGYAECGGLVSRSVSSIVIDTGLATSTVNRALRQLVRKRLLERTRPGGGHEVAEYRVACRHESEIHDASGLLRVMGWRSASGAIVGPLPTPRGPTGDAPSDPTKAG